MKKFALIFVAVVGLGLVSANEGVAQVFRSGVHIRPTGLFNFQFGFGYPTPYYGGHWDWHSSRYYRHGNHFHYSPGHFDWHSPHHRGNFYQHRGGHWRR